MSVSLLLLLIPLAILVLGPLLAPRHWLEAIPAPFRILAGLGALVIAAFCGFGFLVTFEPLDPLTQWGFRLLYTVAGFAAIGGAIRLFRTRTTTASL